MISIADQLHSAPAERIQQASEALKVVLSNSALGFVEVPNREDLWKEAGYWGAHFRELADDMVIVGIGGSSLGPKALEQLFKDSNGSKKILFADNVDGIEFDRLWSSLRDFQRTVWVLVSKSGSTIETLVCADIVLQRYQKKGLSPQIAVVSEKRANTLTDWARQAKAPCLEIPLDVGGRYSVFTAVGMLPMAFLGVDISLFQAGAKKAIAAEKLVSEYMAQVADSFDRQEWISFLWFYSSYYVEFGRWLLQLWAESLGKSHDRQGLQAPRASSPFAAIGSIDQHSILQQVIDGAKDKFVTFVRFSDVESAGEAVLKSQFHGQEFFNGHSMGQLIAAQAQGTRQALNTNGISTVTLLCRGVDPESVGFQMMFWKLVVAGLGEMMNINAFDQPGVELGKRLAKKILIS